MELLNVRVFLDIAIDWLVDYAGLLAWELNLLLVFIPGVCVLHANASVDHVVVGSIVFLNLLLDFGTGERSEGLEDLVWSHHFFHQCGLEQQVLLLSLV